MRWTMSDETREDHDRDEWDYASQGPVRTRERVAAAICCAMLLAIVAFGLIDAL